MLNDKGEYSSPKYSFQKPCMAGVAGMAEPSSPIFCGVCRLQLSKPRVHYGGESCYPCRAFFRLYPDLVMPVVRGGETAESLGQYQLFVAFRVLKHFVCSSNITQLIQIEENKWQEEKLFLKDINST